MRSLTITLLLLLISNSAFTATVTGTYNAGDIPTNNTTYSAACNGPATPLTVSLPAGGPWIVTSVEVDYDMTAASGAWKSEQRSKLYCQNTTTGEAAYTAGAGGNSAGTESYNRAGLTIANNTYTGGTNLIFEMQAYRTWTGGGTCNTTYNKIDNGSWIVTVTYSLAGPMTYTSSTVTQTITSTVENCASDVEIIGIEVVTSGTGTPIDITQLRLRTTGSTSPAITANISNIDIYYTGTSSTFATTTFFGDAAPLAAGNDIDITGTQTLSDGTNYFWVVYDMAVGSNIGDLLDARCTRITVDGSNEVPTVTTPAGTRTIATCNPSPGSVASDLKLWFKSDASVYSDAGVTAVTNGGTIQQWNEQSGNASVVNTAQTTGTMQPVYDENPFNYNPAIFFDGVNDFLASGAIPFSNFTDGSKISMYGVMQSLGVGTCFTWDDAGVGAKIVLSGSPFYDRNGGNSANTGISNPFPEQHLISSIVGSNTLSVYAEGNLTNTSTIVNLTGTNVSSVAFGKLYEHGWPGSVLFGEVAVYDASHSAADKNRIESYFAVKYGITLDNSAGGIAGDYSASFSTQVWDADVNANYHNNVIGIARDDNQSLLQKQSHTIDDTTRIYLNTLQTTNVANTGSFAADVSYIIMGDNQGLMNAIPAATAEVPTGLTGCAIAHRIEREWKVTKTNITEDFSWDITLNNPASNTASVNVAHLRLLIDDDGNFTNGGSCYYNGDGTGIVITYNNPVITISGISTAHIPNNSTRYITIASINSLTPLPVKLTNFDVACQNETPQLSWTTASEINNDYFTIERGSDATNFEAVGTVNGNGNSNTATNYTWTDDSPINETTYYRLKQTDFNGAVEYHGIKSANCEQLNDINIYPNPFETSFTVQLSENTTYPVTVEVIDYLGRTVHSQVIKNATTEITLDEKIATGTYFVKVFNETTQVVERLVKME